MARLVYHDPVTKQQITVEIGPNRPAVVIGRNDDCTVRVLENSVSRYHAVIHFNNGIYTVNDPPNKAAVNGIFINGHRKPQYQETQLSARCEIRCGAFPLYFVNDSEGAYVAPKTISIQNPQSAHVHRSVYSLTCQDSNQREGLTDWLMGHAFAFYRGTQHVAHRVQYLGANKIDLGGLQSRISVKANPVNMSTLEAIFTDRDLYKEHDDTTRVVVFAPNRRTAFVELLRNDEKSTSFQVNVDDNGLGLYELPGLMPGEYCLKLGQSKTQFTVAGFSLAPLTALLKDSQLSRNAAKEELAFHLYLETYGVPFGGNLAVEVMNLEHRPPKRVSGTHVFAVDGEVKGQVALRGNGPFELQIRAKSDGLKTATVPLPGSRKAERELLTLSDWGQDQWVASLLPFEGAERQRGIWIGKKHSAKQRVPIALIDERCNNTLKMKARFDINALCLVVLDPWSHTQTIHMWDSIDAERILELPLKNTSPWALLMAGAHYTDQDTDRCWEGRAAFIANTTPKLSITAPQSCAPSDTITLHMQGFADASAFVLVKDMRLQSVDSPTSATAASLRLQIQKGLGLFADQEVSSTLSTLIPQPIPTNYSHPSSSQPYPPFMPQASSPSPMPGMPSASAYPPGYTPSAAIPSSASSPQGLPPNAQLDPSTQPQKTSSEKPPLTRHHFPEVMFAQIVRLNSQGEAEIPIQMGEAIGLVGVEAFCVSGRDWADARTQIQIKRDLFGELTLPRFVRRGDFAEGRLFVHNATNDPVRVEVKRDGHPLPLVCAQGSFTELSLNPPGDMVAFVAEPGQYEACVQGTHETDRTQSKIEEPGKLIWRQKALRLLMPGETVSTHDPGVLSLRVLPNLDQTFHKMVGGLLDYAHHCCEQTSAILLAATATYLTAKDDHTKAKAENHMRSCIARERTMYLPGKGFKGWPNYPPEVFRYSPGATLNLLQMDMLSGHPMSKDLQAAVDDCLLMARDAAQAHHIDPAPQYPQNAREAYGRFRSVFEDRPRLIAFIRERIEPWHNGQRAILKFELPYFNSETYHKTPAMIRAETAFAAAILVEAGGPHLAEGLRLANTVMSAVQENGSLYSTLDSVAAITLLTSMKRAGIGTSNDTLCELNAQPTNFTKALTSNPIQSLRAVRGALLVEVERLIKEDLTTFNHGVQAEVFLKHKGRATTSCHVGDSLELVVKINNGYEPGDLLHIFLPSALSWIHGGGLIKKCTFDLQGKPEIIVPLAATSLTLDADGNIAPQHFAICIRNMYDETRGLGLDNLSVTVSLAPQLDTNEPTSWAEPISFDPIERPQMPPLSAHSSAWSLSDLNTLIRYNQVLDLQREELMLEYDALQKEIAKHKSISVNHELTIADLKRRLDQANDTIHSLQEQLAHLQPPNPSEDQHA